MINDTILLILAFTALPALCITLERMWPQVKGYRLFRKGFGSDVIWYLVQTTTSHIVAPWIVFAVVLPVLIFNDIAINDYWNGYGVLGDIYFPLQVFIVFVLADFLSYWQHRLFHTRRAWAIHAVHHSSEDMDWLGATRFHPLNEIGAQLIYMAPLIAIGFSPLAFVVLAPFTAAYAVVLHANVNWDFGKLKYLFASPTFHRWHHTSEKEGIDKNFAGFLPVWDVIFGTFYYPEDRVATKFGIHDHMPSGFVKQLFYPFRKERSVSSGD